MRHAGAHRGLMKEGFADKGMRSSFARASACRIHLNASMISYPGAAMKFL